MLDAYLEQLLLRGKARYYGVTLGGGCLLLLLTGWIIWHYVYLNPENVFWGAVSNNLIINGVTKHTVSGNEQSKADEYNQISLGAHNIVHGTTVTTQTGVNNATVKSETVGTPNATFARYTTIQTNKKLPSGQPLDFKSVVGLWSKQVTDDSTNSLFAQTVFDAFPFAHLNARQRQQIMNQIHQDEVYTVDFAQVTKQRKNGHLYYQYDVTISPDKYVTLLKQVDNFMGLNQLQKLDPSQYQGTSAVPIKVTIDAKSHQMSSIVYTDNSRQQEYSAWGAQIATAVPQPKFTQVELQTKLNAILNGQ